MHIMNKSRNEHGRASIRLTNHVINFTCHQASFTFDLIPVHLKF